MDAFAKPLSDWFETILGLELCGHPIQNMLAFPAGDVQAARVSEKQLTEFLAAAFREYSKKAAKLHTPGWFYAWFDEMSGTLRCSFVRVRTAADLPFRCKLIIANDPGRVAELTLASPYSTGIPLEEFSSVADPFADEPPEEDFELTVFARPVMTLQ